MKTMRPMPSFVRRAILLACLLTLSSTPASSDGHAAGEPDAAPSPPGRIEFVGRNLFGAADGVFHQWRVVESRLDPAAIGETYAVVEIDLRSVDTGIADRDDHLRNPDFFETETYPTATARVHSLRAKTESSDDGVPSFDLSIDLDLHGVQKTLPGQAKLIQTTAEKSVFEGSTTLDRTDFGVGPKASRWNPISPAAEIPIRFWVELPVSMISAQGG